jgi:superfamily II DNA or RNA helicase
MNRYRPFNEAREFARRLGLPCKRGWHQYCNSDKKPPDIPSHPERTYKDWTTWPDFLGTGNIATQNKNYLPFLQAREYVRKLNFQNYEAWREYCRSGKKRKDIPSTPDYVYKGKGWNGWGDFLGIERKHLSFIEAREYVRKQVIQDTTEWHQYLKSGRKPDYIPSHPDRAYDGRGWTDWYDFLGIERKHLSFTEAREIVRKLGLPNQTAWREYCRSGKKRKDIPSTPDYVYKGKGWNGWGDFLGTQKRLASFTEAREIVRKLGLPNQTAWRVCCKSGNKPDKIPAHPERTYKGKGWNGWGDFLGIERKHLSFTEARAHAHEQKISSYSEWQQYIKSGNKPDKIPAHPERTYKGKGWNGWGDFLGTGNIALQDKEYLPFTYAREYVREQHFQSRAEWEQYCKSGNKPDKIPSRPDVAYDGRGYTTMGDWLGTGNIATQQTGWTINKVKELLRALIESGIIYDWNEAVLFSLLNRKGLLNLDDGNRHSQFFKKLIEASRTEEGRATIEEYVNSDLDLPPDLSGIASTSKESVIKKPEQEIQTASSQELARLIENNDPLDYGEPETAKQILAHSNFLESISVDEEAIQFYLTYSINQLWKRAFMDKENEENTVADVRLEGKNGNRYHDTVVETFLSDYVDVRNITIPEGYSFPKPPTLMQLYVTHKIKTVPYVGNFSGTGAGKTLSAVLASRVIDSKMTIVVSPNDVVDQWERAILEVFPDSEVIKGKGAFDSKYDDRKHKYLVLNYDKFSQEQSPNLILNLVNEKVDFVILDEVHFVKKRDEDSSQRRRNLGGLMTAVRNKNNQIKVLALSATPVVNNLMEGRSLLELITGKVYDDVAIRPTIPNAVTLYEKLSTISIRELPKYTTDWETEHIEVKAVKPPSISIKQLKSNPLEIEQFLTDARIPEIISHIDGQTVIYTEYVTDVVAKISNAVKNAGYSYDLYTGDNRSGLRKFLDKKIQVLIASRPISVGIDGLQHICNRLIINTLPWTNAQYQQLLGRLVRKGQIRDVVYIYIIKATVGGYPYDQLKWNRIQFKRTLANCAVDGILPEKNLVTPQQAAMEAVKWLERLERGEISSVVRRDLNIELTPIEIEHRIRKYGDFTKLNNLINNEKSENTHERMLKDPKEWDEYHRQYREARTTWSIIPYVEIIKRIEQLSSRLQIGDFGCGEAKIMEAIGENRVYSFDHIAINDKVTACDMKSVDLPDDALDIAVFSLSLMGRNWPEYIIEAKRCLATNGYLLIAETTKSLNGRLSKLRHLIMENGFEIYEDQEKGDFTFIEARKI